MKKQLAVSLMVALVVVGVSLMRAETAGAEQELIISAAASLTNAFQEIGQKFESANPGTKIVPNFAASGALLQQIEKGAPVDVFASADQKTMNQASEKKLILPDTRKNFVSNSLVLIIPAGSKIAIKGPQDLTAKEVARVALGNPESVPAGRYTQEALTGEGLWESLKAKFIPADSVRQVLDYVGRGEVDAGFVFATDAAVAKDKVQVVTTLQKHETILYPLAIVAATPKKELAQRFIDFVMSKEGQEMLSRYGFGKP
jgi:molybdate transport system substrate-binding protein